MQVSDFVELPVGHTYQCSGFNEIVSLLISGDPDAEFYCPKCKKERLFGYSRYGDWCPSNELSHYNDVVKCVFACNCGSEIEILLKILPDFKVVKVGQYPDSLFFDKNINTKIVNILPETARKHYNNAIRAYTSNLHIAAFNYLRRVLETIVQSGERQCNIKPSKESKMKERIALLVGNNALPDILIEPGFNTLYSLLSRGIHELEEEKCREQYPFLKDAIEVVLVHQLAEKEQAKQKTKLSKALNALNSGNKPK